MMDVRAEQPQKGLLPMEVTLKSAMGRKRIESPVSVTAPPPRRSPKPPIRPGPGVGGRGRIVASSRARERQISDRARA